MVTYCSCSLEVIALRFPGLSPSLRRAARPASGHGISAGASNTGRCCHGRFHYPGPLPEGEGKPERVARGFHGSGGVSVTAEDTNRCRDYRVPHRLGRGGFWSALRAFHG
jgi:hypothetical protein